MSITQIGILQKLKISNTVVRLMWNRDTVRIIIIYMILFINYYCWNVGCCRGAFRVRVDALATVFLSEVYYVNIIHYYHKCQTTRLRKQYYIPRRNSIICDVLQTNDEKKFDIDNMHMHMYMTTVAEKRHARLFAIWKFHTELLTNN